MGIFIDKRMPKNCMDCPCVNNFTCNLLKTTISGIGRRKNCPLFNVPLPGEDEEDIIDKKEAPIRSLPTPDE